MHLTAVITDESSSRKGGDMIDLTNTYEMSQNISGKKHMARNKHNTLSHQDRSKWVRKTGRRTSTSPRRVNHGRRKESNRRSHVSVIIGSSRNIYYDVTSCHI